MPYGCLYIRLLPKHYLFLNVTLSTSNMKRSARTAEENEANREAQRRYRARPRVGDRDYTELHSPTRLWLSINVFRTGTVQIPWNKTCSYCGTRLLSTEANGWCCNRGKLNRVNLLPAIHNH
jgi:hypothetical protein